MTNKDKLKETIKEAADVAKETLGDDAKEKATGWVMDFIKGVLKGFFGKLFLWLLAAVVVFNIISSVIGYARDSYDCHSAWKDSNIEYQFTFRGGCKVKKDGGYIPAANYRVN